MHDLQLLRANVTVIEISDYCECINCTLWCQKKNLVSLRLTIFLQFVILHLQFFFNYVYYYKEYLWPVVSKFSKIGIGAETDIHIEWKVIK